MKLSYIESKIFGKVCYGFCRNKDGIVETIPDKATVVRIIFSLHIVIGNGRFFVFVSIP